MELTVGRVVKAHGITGEVVVDVRTDDPELRFAPGVTLHARKTGAPQRDYVVETARPHGARLLVRLAGVGDRDGADALRGSVFVVDSADLPPITEADTYYDHQLEGLLVRTGAGRRSAPSPRCCTPPPANCWRSSGPTDVSCWSRSSPRSSRRCR